MTMWCRPLPRGLIKYSEAVRVINFTLVAVVVFAVAMGLRFNWTVALLFGFQVSKTATATTLCIEYCMFPVDILHMSDVY